MTNLETAQAVFTPDEAAEYLQVSHEAIMRHIEAGTIEAERLGDSIQIPRRSLERLSFIRSPRPDFTPRMYTDEQLAAFAEEDVLDGTALEIARRFAATHGMDFFDRDDTDHK